MTPNSPKPSMHDVVTEYYVPNTYDTGINITVGFGATINIISDGTECNTDDGTENSIASERIAAY